MVGIFEELKLHRPFIPDIEQQRKQQGFRATKFLVGLRSEYDGVEGPIFTESKAPYMKESPRFKGCQLQVVLRFQ